MEKYSKELYEALSKIEDVAIHKNSYGNKALPFFIVTSLIKIIVEGRRYDIIHLGDGLLAILIPFINIFTKKTVTITIHGLDITFKNRLYQSFVIPQLRKADRIICISKNTYNLCLTKRIPQEKLVVIPDGISFPDDLRRPLPKPTNVPILPDSAIILCTIGRLVKRKGHEWFIRKVMKKLDDSYVYLIAGDGPEAAHIKFAIIEEGLDNRVFLLGAVDENTKEWLLRNSYLFIMPNIPVQGDVEGFGLVLIEAASRGLMAIAANIDGIPDAVVPAKTAILVPPEDADAFTKAIITAMPDRQKVASEATLFSWDHIAKLYIEEMKKACSVKQTLSGSKKERNKT